MRERGGVVRRTATKASLITLGEDERGFLVGLERRWTRRRRPAKVAENFGIGTVGLDMQFDTKIALVIRSDLESWQKMNVAAFLASGVAAAFPACIGESYEDGSGTIYHRLIGQPILIYGGDKAALARALDRASSRGVQAAVYTMDMFKTTHDAANRAAVKAVARADLDLAGLGVRAERKVIDKIVDGLKFSS